MNANEPNTEDNLFEFRDENLEKLRKQQELKLEYQRFKAKNEERFRNRFAHKKTCSTEPSDSTDEQLANRGSSMDALLKKLDILQKSVEDLRILHAKSNLGSNFEGSKKELNEMNQAARRLSELEEAIESINISENIKSPVEIAKFSIFQETNGNIPSQSEFFPGHEVHASIHEKMKRIEKERYANELKRQIEEKHQLKEQRQRREREEDLIRLAEICNYDSLGHRIRERPGELLSKNPSVPGRRLGTYARGGNGIFGAPLTESQKMTIENYRNELILQIEEKRLQKSKSLQKEKEMELKELQKEKIGDVSMGLAPEPQVSESHEHAPHEKKDILKQSVCVQAALEHLSSRPKGKKVIRNSLPKETIQKFPKYEGLLAQVSQLKMELAAEKLRVERDRFEAIDVIHIYDPRSIPKEPITPFTWFANRSLKRPVRVHRAIAATSPPSKTKSRLDRQVTLSSGSLFLPEQREIVPRSPSVSSLNLEEIHRQMNRRFEQLRINGEVDDLYKNEEPIIREFMAEEEARMI